MKKRHLLAVGALALTSLATAHPAHAGFTSFSMNGGEPNVLQILDRIYGLENLERMHDFDHKLSDQIWSNDHEVAISVVAKYSRAVQRMGIQTGGEGGEFRRLMVATGYGTMDRSTAFSYKLSGLRFRFMNDPRGGERASSQMYENKGMDSMITWRVVGNEGRDGNVIGSYVVAWEDRPGRGDNDFNDLVMNVQHRQRAGEPDDDGGMGDPVPEPSTLLLLGLGGTGLAYMRRKRGSASGPR